MTERDRETPAVDWASEIGRFLEDGGSTRNPRSITAEREVGGRRYHFKHSERSLASDVFGLRLAATIRSEGVAAPRLVLFDRPRNVVVTELEPGESLFNVLWNESSWLSPRRRDSAGRAEILRRLAAWLAAFHGASADVRSRGTASRDECLGWLRESFRSKLASVAACRTSPLGRRDLECLRQRVAADLEAAHWRDEPLAYVHGDIAPANQLLREDGSLRVVDFGDGRVGFALEDVVRLWSAIWELSECGGRRRRLFRPLLAGTLTAYGLPAAAAESRPFELLRVWNAVNQVGIACSSRARYDLSTRWIHRRLTAAELRWLRRRVLWSTERSLGGK